MGLQVDEVLVGGGAQLADERDAQVSASPTRAHGSGYVHEQLVWRSEAGQVLLVARGGLERGQADVRAETGNAREADNVCAAQDQRAGEGRLDGVQAED